MRIGDIWSRPTSPIWMDTSTSQECAEIMRVMGGPRRGGDAADGLARLRAFHRTADSEICQGPIRPVNARDGSDSSRQLVPRVAPDWPVTCRSIRGMRRA